MITNACGRTSGRIAVEVVPVPAAMSRVLTSGAVFFGSSAAAGTGGGVAICGTCPASGETGSAGVDGMTTSPFFFPKRPGSPILSLFILLQDLSLDNGQGSRSVLPL